MSAIRPDLPVPPTTFVGREPELRALAAALGDARLVTIAGPGGCGKTRLAIEAAATEAVRRPDGVCWADLTTTADALIVPELVATAAGVLPAADRDAIPSLARQLGDRRMLVCLDNCEHVVEAVAELAAALTRACPGVTVLATSREPLRLPGEVVWRVPPLGAEDAVALFEERAGPVPAPDRDAVRTACARLDGIPLAIELAAAWSGTLSAREILQGLDDRFSLLVRGPRGVAARHQTLAASMAWSHDLLEEDDRTLFRRLGAFHGGFTLDAARGVCGFGPLDGMSVLAGLGRLVDKSLVVADTRGSVARYRMPETVRAYAVALLEASEEADRVRDRHLDTYLALTDDVRPLLARDKDAWRAAVGAEHENLCAAAAWGLSRDDPGRGRLLLAGLPWLWHLNGRGHEGLELLRRAVDRAPDDRTALQARLLTGLALVADTTHPAGPDHDAAATALDIAVEAGDVATACLARLLRAVGLFFGDFDTAWKLAETARSEARESGEEFVADGATALMGMIRHLRDEHDEAEDLFRTATEGLLRRGDRGVASTTLGFWACGALYTGDVERARALAAEAVRTARPLADHHRVGSAASVLATVETAAGRLDEARAALAPLVRLVEGAERPPFVPGLARAMGELELRSGRPHEAVAWFRSETSWLGDGAGQEAALSPQTLTGLAAALQATGDDAAAASACERALTVARAVGMPGVIADALERQARLAEPAGAERLHHEALALRAEHGLWLGCVGSLDALARIAVAAGAHAEATRLFAACDRARTDMGLAPVPADPGPRAALGETAYAAAWAEGGALDVPAAVEWARRARGPRRRPSSGWSALTPAERSVVRLAAEGLSNPGIGARLFMSRSTVKTHLSHVYAKLGVTNRTELAALATPHLAED
ncbi:helix-turn-helix transcriptional regulator [Actinoallomurus iriomotensis]|uniref:LuxR family transcriptional regulator n=1 Tax=Actinoallomurus iriomotensis TaxID=478107 RepID=A0A9W6RPC0_9ACTN|nr:LuxR C-terminal-related transcriptional regulator [Actinoallomurus iriomotensis]GLY77672.1 LuxR family transcriptional regulator [Actinoallomurus iriomotensis]